MRKTQPTKSNLEALVDAKRSDRERVRDREREQRMRIRELNEAPRRTTTDFWCAKCRKDFSGPAYKQVSGTHGRYVGCCPRGHEAYRNITEKNRDPYYRDSEMVRRLRYTMRDDLVQPGDPRFKELYPEQYKKLFPNG